MYNRELITFDWALKRLLRSKANFEVLEGFLSELLKEDLTIQEVLESESNQDHVANKFNRVDLKVKNSKNELIIIEVQYEREVNFLYRMLWSTSKVIVEHLDLGQSYDNVAKVISVNILHFDLGQGDDYIYHGTTSFTGLHTHNPLLLDDKHKQLFSKETIAAMYPEYYMIQVSRFDDVAKDSLDQWVYFLKTGNIEKHFSAKGLQKAKSVLNVLQLPEAERKAFEYFAEDLRYQQSMVTGPYREGHLDGRIEGLAEGKAQGIAEGKAQGLAEGKAQGIAEGKEQGLAESKTQGQIEEKRAIAKKLLATGMSINQIAELIGLDAVDIE